MSRTLPLLSIVTLLAVGPASAYVPATIIHQMTGEVRGADGSGARIAMRLACVPYENDIECTGRLRCKALRDAGSMSRVCDRGQVVLDTSGPQTGWAGDPSTPGTMSLRLAGGGSCFFEGMVPYLFDVLHVPGMTGHYQCSDANDSPSESGVFGFRASVIGKPFHRYR
jgi:hypothetical protein